MALDNKGQGALFFILVNGSNQFIDMSVLYRKNYQLFFFKPFFGTNVVVERVPCCAPTSNSLALTMLMVLRYWLIENQSIFPHESRTAMVLKDDFLIYSEVIRRIMHLVFPS